MRSARRQACVTGWPLWKAMPASRRASSREAIAGGAVRPLSAGQALQRLAVAGRRVRHHVVGQRRGGCTFVPGPTLDLRLLQPVAHELLVVAGRVEARTEGRAVAFDRPEARGVG